MIFLTGDRHRAELTKLELNNTPVIYDLTVSPLSSRTYGETPPENNVNRVEGTLFSEHNFAIVEIAGHYGKRVLLIKLYDKDGKEVWREGIQASYK